MWCAADGELFMMGSNETAQLGTRHVTGGSSDGSSYSWQPVRVNALETHPLRDVACGEGHTMAVTRQVRAMGLSCTWQCTRGQCSVSTWQVSLGYTHMM